MSGLSLKNQFPITILFNQNPGKPENKILIVHQTRLESDLFRTSKYDALLSEKTCFNMKKKHIQHQIKLL